jgi:hypothetical protein
MADAAAQLLASALRYAAAGIPVFPCVPGGKIPVTGNGFHDASSDADVVRAWWQTRPHANIAMPTGALPEGRGYDVLDLDVRDTGNGWHAFHRARRAGLVDGWVRVVVTPSGGLHLYYPGTSQRNGSLREQHLDFRGVGGYVLLPPSIGQTKHYSNRYHVEAERPGPGKPLNWAAVVALLAPAAPPPSPPRRPVPVAGSTDPTPWLASHVARQTEGNRNSTLFWAACRAVEAGAPDLQPLIDAAVYAGLSEREARRTVVSAETTGRRSPRRAVSAEPQGPSR